MFSSTAKLPFQPSQCALAEEDEYDDLPELVCEDQDIPAIEGGSYAIPREDKYDEYRSLVTQFDTYMRLVAVREKRTDSEHLLEWLDVGCTESWVKNYDKFLLLAQAVANHGYKTAIDVPLTEEEFHYRKYTREFDDWMQSNKHSDKTHLELLLICIDKKSNADDFTYQQFLILSRITAKKGYLTMIDIPISEREFNDFFLKKCREFADKLVNEYHGRNPQRLEFIKTFSKMANASNLDISPYKHSRMLLKALHLELESIKAEYQYHFISPKFNNHFFFSTGSRVYSMIKNHIGDVSSNVNRTEREEALETFRQFQKDNASNALDTKKVFKI